jgi:DNA invertase Pin-like site-specific DNA recombinase
MNSAAALVPAAQYVRMSTDLQQYSIENQKIAIKDYAARHGFLVTCTYEDAGRSGVVLKRRPGLCKLLQDVTKGEVGYKAILVYDVSRWGRFQDIDEAAYWEFLCKRANVPVHYCAEQFANDGNMNDLMMKALKRVLAGEYSRDLSAKVSDGMRQMVLRGFRMGARPGYALRRVLVSPSGKRKQFLKDGESKNIKTDRVILTPGPPAEVACVKAIYHMFVNQKKSTGFIARSLNDQGITNRGKPWNYQAILKILKHEKYTGSMVWGRWTQKLRTRTVPVPREKWTVLPNAFDPVISRATFEAAGKRLRDIFQKKPTSEILKAVRALLKKEGRLSAQLLNQSRNTPCQAYCRTRFGSLTALYKLVGYRPRLMVHRRATVRQMDRLHNELCTKLKSIFQSDISFFRENFTRRSKIRFSDGQAVNIVICRAERTCRGSLRWRFCTDSAKRTRTPVLMCLCNHLNSRLKDYFVFAHLDQIHISALLKHDDCRLQSGIPLRQLRDMRKILMNLAK